MGIGSGSLSRWTRYFTVASALGLLVVQVGGAFGIDRLSLGLLAMFGFVCPMIFGMAYLLLPSYVGRTLADQRLPGLHFTLSFLGAGCIVTYDVFGLAEFVLGAGIALWSVGIVIFVGLLAWTIVPGIVDRPGIVLRSDDLPQRSTRLGTATIPLALLYLCAGTVALLGRAGFVPPILPTALPNVLHYYATGFGALLIFALGVRLLTGFFHVAPPRYASWVVLLTGSIAPAFLGTQLWGDALFQFGAILEAIAFGGYALLVAVVIARSDWSRIGLYGIAGGAGFGVFGVMAGLVIGFSTPTQSVLRAHALLQIGFFALTIVGYAYQFFPVTTGRFPGATDHGAIASIGLLGSGMSLQVIGGTGNLLFLQTSGGLLGVIGASGYLYLLGRRLLSNPF